MRWLEITTVVGCKNMCSYCPQSVLLREYDDDTHRMSFETFRACLTSVPTNVDVHFSGYAEPWLNRDCTRMLVHAAEKGHQISVYTTLVGMSPDDWNTISQVPFVTFLVHLPDADGLMKARIDDDYLKLLDTVAATRPKGLVFRTIGTQSPHITQIIGPQPVEALDGGFVHSRAGNVDPAVMKPRARHMGAILCTKGRTTKNVLLPNGDVTLCCMDYGLEHVLGNLLTDDYESLHSSDEYRRIIAAMAEASAQTDILCRRCEWASPEGDGVSKLN